jgi:modulator of drug activity B
MKNVLIINAHQYYSFAEGKLNKALIEKAEKFLKNKDYKTKITTSENEYNVEEELEKHKWADIILLQTPINWMGVTWSFKKYMDEVYSAGMQGALCNADGRHSHSPKRGYGTGGTMTGKQYMLSLTVSAPEEAFNDPSEYLFQGKSIDDLWFPMHVNFRYFGMEQLPTFACYDVIKNPEIENDFKRFETHLDKHFL